MAPFLSPILSSGEDDTPTCGQARSATVVELDKRAKKNSAASTGSQMSELDRDSNNSEQDNSDEEELDAEEEDLVEKLNNCSGGSLTMKRHLELEQQQQLQQQSDSKQYNNNTNSQQRRSKSASNYTGANSSAASSKSGSLAEQYLLATASNHHHHQPQPPTHDSSRLASWFRSTAGGGFGAGSGKRKFNQVLQSIPLPVLATSLVTVLVFCVLLSESRTFQLAEAQSPDSPSGTPSETQQQTDSLPLVMSHQSHHHRRSQPEETNESDQQQQQPDGPQQFTGTFEQQQQQSTAAVNQRVGKLRRGIIAEFLQRQQLASQQQKHHQAHNLRRSHQPHIERREQRDSSSSSGEDLSENQAEGEQQQQQQQQQQASALDSLGALLLNSGDQQPTVDQSATAVPLENRFIDGGPEAVRPAHLRSSPLELELGEQQQHQQQSVHKHRNPNHQQQLVTYRTNEDHHHHHHSSSDSNNNNNNINNINTNSNRLNNPNIFDSNHDRPFDVPQIQCNGTDEGFERFACPTPDEEGRFRCIEDRLFCDGYLDCPGGEDEDRTSCMYYRLFVSHIDILTNTFITFMKKQNRINTARGAGFRTAG